MMAKDDGGPVFPVPVDAHMHARNHPCPGMSLRDYFAGQALANLYTQDEGSADVVAGWAVQVADAMLAKLRE